MLAQQLQDLYKRYRTARAAEGLSAKEFERVLMIFPAVLVLGADGHIDTTEMMFISQLSQVMADGSVNISEEDIRQEVRFLARNAAAWREPFLEVLRLYIEQYGVGAEVLDIMIRAAASSTGNMKQNILIRMQANGNPMQEGFISEEEKEAILNLVGELGISSDPVVISRLAEMLG